MSADAERRILVVQYAGDYAETWRRLAEGGAETYFAQKHSVDAVDDLATGSDVVAVLVAVTAREYSEVLRPGLVAVGLGPVTRTTEASIVAFAKAFEPTHLLLRTPMTRVLRWALRREVDVLVTLADSFGTGWKSWLRTRQLVRLLNRPGVRWVGNHGVTSSRSLVALGVSAAKVIPWDWPQTRRPDELPAKTLASRSDTWRAIFVGMISEAKGVGDAIRALAVLRGRGMDISLDVVGTGSDFSGVASALGLSSAVRLVGRIPNDAIIPAMRDADLVLVPSRKDYPEGFPLTIYEALCSRTPLVASDHPMFVDKLEPDRSAVIFRAGDPADLANAVERLLGSPDLYAALSNNALAAWEGLQVPVEWSAMVRAWLDRDSTLDRHGWANASYG